MRQTSLPRRFIALDLILAVEDVFQTSQDKNNASFNVITDGRTYELLAHDQEEKEKYVYFQLSVLIILVLLSAP